MWNGISTLHGTIVPLCLERNGAFHIPFPSVKFDNPDESGLQEVGKVFACTPFRHPQEIRNVFV